MASNSTREFSWPEPGEASSLWQLEGAHSWIGPRATRTVSTPGTSGRQLATVSEKGVVVGAGVPSAYGFPHVYTT